jgi:hypothetical protein
MSFILRSHHDRYRQRNRESLIRTTVTLCLVGTALTCGYLFGQQRAVVANDQMKSMVNDMQKRAQHSESAMINLRSQNETLSIELNQLKGQYNTQVPTGDMQALVQLIKEQLDKGMSVSRLSQIIKAARPPQNCSAAQSKRFILSTAAYEGPESKITFAEGMIAISGYGEATINARGEKEAWFDAGKKVKVTFTQPGGVQEIKEGILPLQHTIIRNDKEYRFSISQGPRSFVVVTSDNCDYLEADRGHYRPNVRTTTTTINPAAPQPSAAESSTPAADPTAIPTVPANQ